LTQAIFAQALDQVSPAAARARLLSSSSRATSAAARETARAPGAMQMPLAKAVPTESASEGEPEAVAAPWPRSRCRLPAVSALAVLLVVAVCAVAGGGSGGPIPVRGRPADVISMPDWGKEARLAPWTTSIVEGAEQGVALVCGQAMKPDGTPSQVLVSRAKGAKKLLDDGKVVALMVSGGDPAGVGKTEAFAMRQVLMDEGIPEDKIILESQAFTTAENFWFAMRWIPPGTGKFYIVTSEFHAPRAWWTANAVFNHFYKMLEDEFKDDERWTSTTKKYPRLEVIVEAIPNFCGTDPSTADDVTLGVDVSRRSLAFRAMREMDIIQRKPANMYGAIPKEGQLNMNAVWFAMIDVNKDEETARNWDTAIAQQMNVVTAVCVCKGSMEGDGPEIEEYPLALPISSDFPAGKTVDDWEAVKNECNAGNDPLDPGKEMSEKDKEEIELELSDDYDTMDAAGAGAATTTGKP